MSRVSPLLLVHSLAGVLMLLLLSLPQTARAQEPVPCFEAAPCEIAVPPGLNIECGYLVVPEDRSHPQGRTIRLGVAILKSQVPQPHPDPLIVLNGGPGGQALEYLPRFLSIFGLFLTGMDRDVILFDQRGVGVSQPALDCQEAAPFMIRQALGEALTPEEIQAPYRACRERWLAQNVDLAAYTTAASAADVHDLWHTLGYANVNLYGVSYGTLLAQSVLRDYGANGQIRSVILDSAYPLSIYLFEDMDTNLADWLGRVFAACAAEPLCRTFYPDLEQTFYTLVDELNRQPRRIPAADPANKQPFTFTFDGFDLIDLIAATPYRLVPLRIYQVRDGEYHDLIQGRLSGLQTLQRYGTPPNRAMAYSILCSQRLYAEPQPGETGLLADWVQHKISRDFKPLPCAEWPAAPFDIRDAQPVHSSVPTLILAGEYDSTISPRYLSIFQENLPDSSALVVPGLGHGVLASGGICPNSLALQFLRHPEDGLAGLDAACLASLGSPGLDTPFTLPASAARLPVQFSLGLLGVVVAWSTGRQFMPFTRGSRRYQFNNRHNWRVLGKRSLALNTALLLLALLASATGWLQIPPATVLALLLPLLTAVQAAFLFSPQDEPALEILLATPRPRSWLLSERLALLLALQIGLGLLLSLGLAGGSLEAAIRLASAWLAPLLLLSGLAIVLTLAARRAVLGVLVTSLVWFAASLLGDLMVARWPFTWPLHLFLAPDHSLYSLNRWFLGLAGACLALAAAPILLANEEKLLLGARSARRSRAARRVETAAHTPPPVQPRRNIQLWGMLRYESLMQRRGVALAVISVGLLIVPLFGILMSQAQLNGLQAALQNGLLSPDAVRQRVITAMMPGLWMGVILTATLLAPVLSAEALPRDRQVGMDEILDSLPLSQGAYLTGKLFSLWVNLLGCLIIVMLVNGLAWRLAVGPFDLRLYLQVWLTAALPLLLINASSGLLLAAGQPTTRRALLVGSAYSLLCLLGTTFVFSPQRGVWQIINPARPALMMYYLIGWSDNLLPPAIASRGAQIIHIITNLQEAHLSLLAGALQVLILSIIVYFQLKRKS